jgi:hypothetical protein
LSIPLRIAETTGRYQRSLRRYRSGPHDECPVSGYHNASTDIEVVTEPMDSHGDHWPHDDARWPAQCECGCAFTDEDRWQRNDDRICALPDGTEFVFRGSFGRCAPPGSMLRAEWYDEYSRHPGKIDSWVIALPDGGDWITSSEATGGGYWTVTGTPPAITASPSIFHNAPSGWHGFIRDGELVAA